MTYEPSAADVADNACERTDEEETTDDNVTVIPGSSGSLDSRFPFLLISIHTIPLTRPGGKITIVTEIRPALADPEQEDGVAEISNVEV